MYHQLLTPPEKQARTLKYGEEKENGICCFNQHNGYTRDSHVLRRTYFSSRVSSLGQSLYEDGQWHSTATAPGGVNSSSSDAETALQVAREDAAQRGQKHRIGLRNAAAPQAAAIICHKRMAKAGFHPTGSDFYGKNEHELTMDAGDGGAFKMRSFSPPEIRSASFSMRSTTL